jgi:hypothetical protein
MAGAGLECDATRKRRTAVQSPMRERTHRAGRGRQEGPAANRMDAAGFRSQTLTRAPDVRYVRRSPKLSRAMPVFKEPAGHTLEIVPPFGRLHATEHRVQILQWTIAVETTQRGRWNFRVLRHGCRSHQAWSATLPGCGGVVTHAGDWSNRLSASPPRNPVHFAAAVFLFQASRPSVRSTATTKLSPPATFPCVCWFTRADGIASADVSRNRWKAEAFR